MLNKLYFCLFCAQKFETNDEKCLKNHLINRHFDGKEEPIVKKWVGKLVSYQTELNSCLSSEPKSLPKSEFFASNDNNGIQKLLRGCPLCDRIILCFKLEMNCMKKSKNVCICGGGREVNKIVVTCHQCKHLYHYQCVEPTGYSGEETSLYKCLKCKRKDFEISDLSSESARFQPLHVNQHLNYQPFICTVITQSTDSRVVCKESFFGQNFLKTHLKSEHKLTPNEIEISKNSVLHSIPIVQRLIDLSFKKLSSNNSSHQTIGQISGQNSSALNQKRSPEFSENLMTNKRLRTEALNQSISRRGSGDQIFQESTEGQSSNAVLGPPPNIKPVSTHYKNKTHSSPPQLTPITRSPPVLVNQSNFIPNNIQTNNNQTNSQMPPKRGRGRPKGSKSKTGNRSNGSHMNGTNGRKIITPDSYIADGNPQLKSRLSAESRLSRPNISLSREQEKALQVKRSKPNGNKSAAQSKRNRGDDSSDWDSDTEMFEKGVRTDQHRIFGSSVNPSPLKERLSVENRSQSDKNMNQKTSELMTEASTSSAKPPQSGESSQTDSSEQGNWFRHQKKVPSLSPSEPAQMMRSVPYESPPLHRLHDEEVVFQNTETNISFVEHPINESQPLFTEIIRAEESNHSVERQTDDSPVISSHDNDLQNEEPIVNQNSVLSDWLTHTTPKKFPYFPQIHDEVIYIPYGHQLYVKAVRQYGLYRQTNLTKYMNSEHIDKVFFAKVKEIKYEKQSNVRLTRLTLTLIDNQIETNHTFHLKFHDIDNVLDFIVLRQTYENSLMRNWKIGDSFRAIIEEKWWFGSIQSYNCSENSMKTQFQTLNVVWGNGATDLLSLWDLEPVIGELPQNRNTSIEVTDEDRNKFYVSDTKEWPTNGKTEECKRIANGLTQIMELNEYRELMEVFDHSNSEYMNKVPYLINLSIVRSRVQNMFYRRHAAIKYDIKVMESNSGIIDPNGTNGVVRNARIVVSICLKFIDEHRTSDIQHIYKRVMEDPSNLSRIKYYACTRPNMNPNPNIGNPLIANSCAQMFFTDIEGSMTILTPSTTRPIVNTIRRSNDSQISVIELSDSEEDNDNDRDSQQRVQQMVDQLEDYVVSPTAPDSPQMPSLSAVDVPNTPRTSSQISRPVVPVRAQPIEERSPQQSSDVFKRYFCILCNEKFVDRNEAMDHYMNELKVKLKCTQCPQNLNFDSWELYSSHNSDHMNQIKTSINCKTYLNAKTWIEGIIEYMDGLSTPLSAQNQIHDKYGDCCTVCKCLNVLTPDSQPFFHKNVFENNRISMKSSVKAEVEFAQHLRRHLKYKPIYYCTLCTISKSDNVFNSTTVNDDCRRHLVSDHNIEVNSDQISDMTAFFGNTKIPDIDNLIPDAINLFIVNCSNW